MSSSFLIRNSYILTIQSTAISTIFSSGNWGGWTAWTACVGECTYSMGLKFRSRVCLDPTTDFNTNGCPGDYNQTVPCIPTWGSEDCPISKFYWEEDSFILTAVWTYVPTGPSLSLGCDKIGHHVPLLELPISCFRLDQIRLDQIRLDQIRLDQMIGLDQIRLDQIRLDQIRF